MSHAADDRIRRLSPAKRALFERWRQARAQSPTALPSGAPIPRRGATGPAPLSFAQERLWLLDQLEPNNPFYNVALAVRLLGPLDRQALEEAIGAVIARHEALRTTFRATAGRGEQVVLPRIDWSLAWHDLTGRSLDAREDGWKRLAEMESLRPFNLAQGPLVRGALVGLGRDEHILLLTLHHIVCDGWSMHVLQQEVAQCYAAALEGRPAPLPPLDIQYADFAVWQRGQLQGPVLERLLAFWSNQLADVPPALDLPLDFGRPPAQSFRGAVCRRRVGAGQAAALGGFARAEDATLFMVMLAAWQVLLARYSGQRRFCVGTPIANRNHPQLERLIGFFANTLALGADLDGNPTWRQLLAQLKQTTLAAYAHQDLPFERLIEHLAPPRDASRTPIFQVMFVLQNIPLKQRMVEGLSMTEVSFDHAPVSNFDLTLNVGQRRAGLDLSLIYNPDLFTRETIEQMLDSYELLLDRFVSDPRQRTLEVPMLTPALRRRLVQTFNDTSRPFPQDQCIHDLVAGQARRTPCALAVSCDDKCLTYEQLEQQSTRLARELIERGVGPDVAVGVCLPRSADMIVALLAILKAGGAYLPLDPQYPRARLDYMAGDSAIRLLVTNSEVARRWSCDHVERVLLDRRPQAIDVASEPAPTRRARPRHLAYVLYTSGSSGQPKAVEVEHRGLVNHALEIARRLKLTAGDRVLQFLSLSFDAAAEEIFATLASGATLQLHPAPAELSGRVLLDFARAHGVNVLHLPPAVWLSLVEELSIETGACGGGQKTAAAGASFLKAVMIGGESVACHDAARFRQLTAGQVSLWFAYGVTEATITSTLFDAASPVPPTATGRLPIGKPIANTRAYVLDEFGQPVPIGVSGELYLGGVGVARGYRNRPALVAERFLPDPFVGQSGARMYRTGDRARWLHDGSLEFLGRLDQQIKVRGYRVEPGEIEAALVEHPEVREAVVASRRDMVGDSLVAFVAAATGPDESALRQFLLARLPQHLVPSRIVVLRELPRLPGGKIDRQTLMATQQFLSLPARATVLPRNEVERALAEIWAAVLGLRDVGMDDNFFEIGGDSIKGIQVVARAAAAGWRITPKDLFQHQTIAQLAPHAIRDGKPTAEQGSVTGSAPLTPIQCEFFAHDLADAHHFNQAVLLEIKPAFGPALLEQAARHIVAHHDALRHRFTRAADGCWQQTVVPNDPRPWLEQVDLSAVADTELARALAEAIETAQASVHLTEGPLARFVHFHLGPRRLPRLVIIVHHLVVDAVSWRALLEDFASACLQLATGREVALPPKTTSFLDWARRLPGLAATDAVRRQTEFWTRPTRCAPLPRDHRHGENLVAAEDHVEVALSAEETARWLHDAQLAFRTRPHELLVAALADTLCAYTGQVEIHIDMEGHGREALFDGVDLSRTVGWFTALYPLALTLPQQRRPDDLIKSIKEQLRAVPTGGVGFGLLRWLAPDAALRARLAEVARGEVSFNYLGQLDDLVPADAPFSLFWQQPGLARSLRARRPHVWEVVAYVRGGCLRVRWQFATTLHRRDTVCALAERCLMVLRELIAYCLEPGVSGATPSDFPLAALDQGDLDRLAEMLDAQ